MGLGSGIRKKPIPDPGPGVEKATGSRIRNTGLTMTTTTDEKRKKMLTGIAVNKS